MIGEILLVDDEINACKVMGAILNDKGFNVTTTFEISDALNKIRTKKYDVIISDYQMPEMNGFEFYKHVKKRQPTTPFILITAYGSSDMAVEVMKMGGYYYLSKPLDYEKLVQVVKEAISGSVNSEKDNKDFQDEKWKIIGESEKLKKILSIAKAVAQSDTTAIIYGESGTGKELIARAIHKLGKRSSGPFVPVNCSALPESLIESELFGHVKGSFTGASNNRIGYFELANNGLLFLDEIGDISPSVQVKLLRVLEEKCFSRVGSTDIIDLNIHLITATNRDLKNDLETNRFRKDLFYRLNVVPIFVPPLRERREDIPLLVDYFLEKYCREKKKSIKILSKRTMNKFLTYSWPGNIRELENNIERLVTLVDKDVIEPEDIFFSISFSSAIEKKPDYDKTLEEIEKEHILKVLEIYGESKEKAAQVLGINRSTLFRKLKRYGIA